MALNAKSVSIAVVLLLAAPSILHAQAIPGYTLQEIVIVPVSGSSVVSNTTLLQAVTYKLRARGVAAIRAPGFLGSTYSSGDAEYAFGNSGFPFFFPPADRCFDLPSGIDIGLAINQPAFSRQKQPRWGGYNSEHVYTIDFSGLGAAISLNYHDCSFGGNHGVLTVEIFRPMQMNLPTNVPASFTDVSPSIDTFAWSSQHSVSGRVHALAVTTDAQRLYAGTFAGVWRSDDRGLTWTQLTQPEPPQSANAVPGAVLVPDVHDIAVSPVNRDLVMVATMSDTRVKLQNGIYRSLDAGNTWTLAKRFNGSAGGPVGQIVFAPDDSNLVFAAGGCAVGISHDAGQTWSETLLPNSATVWHVAVAPLQQPTLSPGVAPSLGVIAPFNFRRVYALGADELNYSTDGGQNWTRDSGISSIPAGVGGGAADNSGNSSRVLAIEPSNYAHVFVAVNALANGPSYYVRHQCGLPATANEIPDGTQCNTNGRGCGEGSIWLGDFTNFNPSDPAHRAAAWTQLDGPPAYWGGSTDSGNIYVETRTLSNNSYLLFFSDRSHVHVSAGPPVPGGWHRMEGKDASATAPPSPYCNQLFVHVDPHALVTSPDFSLGLQAATAPSPYDQNKVAGPNSTGDIWLANDGGIYHANGAQSNWSPAAALATLAPINIAGLAAPGQPPALYMGTGDNDDFFSLDGGATWDDPVSGCGDCDPWFSDPALPHMVMSFTGREAGGGFAVYTSPSGFPDVAKNPADGTQRARWVCPADCNAVSNFSIRGYRPMVLTAPGATAPADGDFVIIGTKQNGARAVFRKTNGIVMATAADWEDPTKASQYGPDLPACSGSPHCIDVVQASGGNAAPVLYAGDPGQGPNDSRFHWQSLWKWSPGMANWQQIIPSPVGTPPAKSAGIATRFFADPYNSNVIYIIDQTAIKRSDDGGVTWALDTSLDNAATESQTFTYNTFGIGDGAVINDVIFARGEPRTRFAVGNAGVFYTLNGRNWSRLLSTSAFPSHPVSAYFDSISDPCDRALYVALNGRGIVRVDPIPRPGLVILPCTTGILHP